MSDSLCIKYGRAQALLHNIVSLIRMVARCVNQIGCVRRRKGRALSLSLYPHRASPGSVTGIV